MSGNFYPVTGIQAGLDPENLNQPKPLRQEVDAWILNPANEKQVNLFFIALSRFQELPVDKTLSYWQVAGIHGQPIIPWDEQTDPQAKDLGYCTHNSLIFPNWHRPYVALFEQRIYDIMLEAVKEFPPATQPDWLAAAQSWRLPYWDWAEKKSRDVFGPAPRVYDVPLIVKPKEVRIEVGDPEKGTISRTIPNPMYTFRTPDGQNMGSYGKYALHPVTDQTAEGKEITFYYNICTATSRHPPLYDANDPDPAAQKAWIEGVQDNDQVAEALRTHDWYQNSKQLIYTDTLSEAVYHMFAQDSFPSYAAFSTTRYVKQHNLPPQKYLNLEDIHNNIHNWVGGASGGFMYEVPVAAFDPIFWLHHCNVDRQLAIWQTLNEGAWFNDPKDQLTDPEGNWSTKPGTVCTPQTPLAPFRDKSGQYHTSDSTRDWARLGYAYPELQRWNFIEGGQLDKERYLASINDRLQVLYNATRDTILVESRAKHGIFSSHAPDQTGSKYTEHHDYLINIRYERYALAGAPFTIHFILGDKYHAGSVFNFCSPPTVTGSDAAGCENCRRQLQEGALQKGQVNLTNVLLFAREQGVQELQDWNPEKIDEYLKTNLTWVVVGPQYREIPVEKIPSLKIYVARGKGRQYHNRAVLSTYADYTPLPAITHGRAGGIGDNDEF